MRILNDNAQGQVARQTDGVGAALASDEPAKPARDAALAEVDKAVFAAMESVQEAEEQREQPDDDGFKGLHPSADVEGQAKKDPLLEAASGMDSRDAVKPGASLDDAHGRNAPIEPRHKEAFTESVLSGDRYREGFELLGGRVRLVIRSRSNIETDAIMAYLRRMVSTDRIRTDYEYSAMTRRLLAIAQVEEINGVKCPVMEEPLFFKETADRLVPPGWEPRIRQWDERPESVLASVVRCILEFEARYWEMIRHVDDEGFWAPDGSTGK